MTGPAPECHKPRYGVQIEFEITCCQDACPGQSSCTRAPQDWTKPTWRLVHDIVSILGNGSPHRPHSTNPLSCPVMFSVICHPEPVRPSLRSPLGPIRHPLPHRGWLVGRLIGALLWPSAGSSPPVPSFGSCFSATAALIYTLHIPSRCQSRPQISKLGCLITAEQLTPFDSATRVASLHC